MFKDSVIQSKKKRDFERKQRLKALSLTNRFLGEWASNILGYNEYKKKSYIKNINKSNKINTNYKTTISMIEKDFAKGDICISIREIEFKVKDFQMKANVIVENHLKFNNK